MAAHVGSLPTSLNPSDAGTGTETGPVNLDSWKLLPFLPTMDTLSVLLFAWVLFGVVVYVLGNYVSNRYLSSQQKNERKDSQRREPTIENVIHKASVQSGDKRVLSEALSRSPQVTPQVPSSEQLLSKTYLTSIEVGKDNANHGQIPGSENHVVFHVDHPVAMGPDPESIKWINDVLRWLYTPKQLGGLGHKAVKDIFNIWITTLRDFTRKNCTEEAFQYLHFVDFSYNPSDPGTIIEVEASEIPYPAPKLSNIFIDNGPLDNLTVTGDYESIGSLTAKLHRGNEVKSFDVHVKKLRGRLNIACITEELFAVAKFDGWPEVQVEVTPTDDRDRALSDLVCDVVKSALRSAVVDLSLNTYPDFPRFVRTQVHSQTKSHVQMHDDGMKQLHGQLLVKVVKASGLGANRECNEPYCTIELDDPPQKFATSSKKETSSPFWDESFLFDLSLSACEILFEIFDRGKTGGGNEAFLGLGIVGIDELRATPSQRQIIPLQSRPYEKDEVSGSLTVEFLFVDDTGIVDFSGVAKKFTQTVKQKGPGGSLQTKTITTYTPSEQLDPVESGVESGIASVAIQELQLKKPSAELTPKQSTLIIHSVQRVLKQPVLKIEKSANGAWHEVLTNSQDKEHGNKKTGVEGSVDSKEEEDAADRGRKRKKRDFFGSLRRRWRSKSRSKSVEAGKSCPEQAPTSVSAAASREGSMFRSISMERATSVPIPDNFLQPGVNQEDSTRSSLSEISGISNSSNRTYVSEASTLVLEVIENGLKKYYLIPLNIAQSNRWKKKGTKLHIYNDHSFVAKHLPGSTVCQVCEKPLGRRLGKQGYECRDCGLCCHKPCHVRTESHCPSSQVQSMELEIYSDQERRIVKMKSVG